MIIVLLFLLTFTLSRCDYEIIEDRSVDEDEPRLFHGYLLKKIKESIPNIIERWKVFKQKYELKYAKFENKHRFFAYAKNAIIIENFMRNNTQPFKIGENKFAMLSREEYFATLGTSIPENELIQNNDEVNPEPTLDVRQTKKWVDWREKNKVTPVRNQKKCGGCYAFAAIATLESAIAIKTGKLLDLSEQAVLDCSARYGNLRCDGGYLAMTYKYLMENSVPSEESYPYKALPGYCKQAPEYGTKIKSFQAIKRWSEDQLTDAIINIGPVAAVVDSRPSTFEFYKEGIYVDNRCSSVISTHGIAVVGVTEKYYIVRNSWGEDFGYKGYMYLARNAGNKCGIATGAYYPIL